jgi:hypothetical protein
VPALSWAMIPADGVGEMVVDFIWRSFR